MGLFWKYMKKWPKKPLFGPFFGFFSLLIQISIETVKLSLIAGVHMGTHHDHTTYLMGTQQQIPVGDSISQSVNQSVSDN